MSKAEKRSFHKQLKIAALVLTMLCTLGLLANMVSSYLTKFEHALVSENSNYLSEIAEHVAVNMQTVVEDTTKALESSGTAISALNSPEEQMQFMKKMKDSYGFTYVGYADTTGSMTATLDSETKNINSENYFKKSLSGESVVRYVPRKLLKDRAITGLEISAPVYPLTDSDADPTGVLVAFFDMKNLSKVMGVESFGGQGYSYIIDMNGEVILHTRSIDFSNLYMALGSTDFKQGYGLDQMISNISTQKEGFSIFSHFGVEKYMYYKYLGIDSWSIVNVVEKNVITAKTTNLVKQLTAIGIVMVISLPLLMIFTVLFYGFSNSQRQAATAKTAFLANMSHEIRTPMNAIVGISEILLRENITTKQKNYVLSIANAGNGLLAIINDILDMSKIESGKFNIIEEEYELESLIYDIVTIASVKINEKPIELMVDLDPDIPKYVTGDMVRLKQVLLNIIGNAIKFTEKGFVKLTVHGKKVGGNLELTMPIQDTGMGIQPKDLEKLFINFNQVDTHKNRNMEGTGLGLVISKRLCEMMGGTIEVDSDYGQGSTFTITVKQAITRPEKMLHISKTNIFSLILLEPSKVLGDYFTSCMKKMNLEFKRCADYQNFLAELKSGGYTHALANSGAIQELTTSGGINPHLNLITILSFKEQSMMDNNSLTVTTPLFTMQLAAVLCNRDSHRPLIKRNSFDMLAIQPMPFINILLVDDNEVNLQVASGLMNPYYMHVDCALSGRKSIEMIQKNDYDLIFMDHMMPEMNGVEAVAIIRSLPIEHTRTIPIVALTANVTQDARHLFLESGFNDFLAKPIEMVKLNAILKKWLKATNDARAKENPEKAAEYQSEIAKENEASSRNLTKTSFSTSEYINFDEGVKKIGSLEVFCNILNTYSRSSKEKMVELPKLLETDLKNFTIEIHGLKGSSASICAWLIAKMAENLETLARENETAKISGLLPDFLTNLNNTLDEIHLFVEKNTPHQPPATDAPLEREARKGFLPLQFMANIKEAFFNYDSENIKVLLESQELFIYEQSETELLKHLKKYYDAYDFETPIELIEQYELTTQGKERG